MRASRLLSILVTLQAQGLRTAASLAEELEVSVRTIYRDIDALSAAGVPIYADRGAGGGFRLLDGYRTRLTGMTGPEAQALLFAGLPGPASQLGLAEAYFSSRLKLLASLPPVLRDEAVRINACFHLDTDAWNPEETSLDLLPDLARAVWEQRRCRIDYRSWTRDSAPLVEPLGLVLKAGSWYLIARTSRAPLTYRLSSIGSVVVLDATFDRAPDFDLAAYWRDAQEAFTARLEKDWARLRVRPHRVERLRRISASVARRLEVLGHDARSPEWLDVRMPIESIAHATGELLRFGGDLEVIEPVELRSALREAARSMMALYAPAP
jgi:predicted DNA-binding transcriptional regulator YafY